MNRACLSGDLSCTGIAPCEACAKMVMMNVLPPAMVAAGFNGNPQIAQSFFLAYKQARVRVAQTVQQHMAAAGQAPEPPPPEVVPEPTPTPEPPPPQVVPEPEPAPLTVAELEGMGEIEDFAESEPSRLTFSPKAARAYARKARKLKQKRASMKDKKEESHGNEEEREEHGDGG